MKTAFLICAEHRETISHQLVDALAEQRVADRVGITTFAELGESIRDLGDVDHIVVFPCVIAMPDARREAALKQVQDLQNERPHIGVHLANPLGCDPRLIEMLKDRMGAALKGFQNAPILTVVDARGARTLAFGDLAALPEQIPDVSAVVPDRRGQGVWVRGLLANEADAQAVFHADDDRFSASVALRLVRDDGLLIYGLDGQPLPASYGGPVRLLIPGYDDRCANVKGVARIEVRRGEG